MQSLCTAEVVQPSSLTSDNSNDHFAKKKPGVARVVRHINLQTLSGSEKEENEIN